MLSASYNISTGQRAPNESLVRAEMLVDLADHHSFQFWSTLGNLYVSIMIGELEPNGNGIRRLRNCLDEYQATGARIGLPTFLGMLAELLGKSRLPEEGLSLVEEALDNVLANGGGVWLAERCVL